MKYMSRCLFFAAIFIIVAQNANASFAVRNMTALQYLTTENRQEAIHTGSNIWERITLGHPGLRMLSHSNGYKALVCGVIGLVIFPIGIKAIGYANAGLKERQDVVMARAGKILGTISYVLLVVGICTLIGWLAYKNPGFAQALGQFFAQLALGVLQGLADNSN